MAKITITSDVVRNMKGTGKESGKPYDMNFQTGYLHTVGTDGKANDFPEKFEFILGKDQKAFPRGTYELHDASFVVGRKGGIEIANVYLTAITK